MELSNVKLIAPARQPLSRISIIEPLEGNVSIDDFNIREMRGKRIRGFTDTFSFVNEDEGYVAQRIGENQYRIKGHWTYGEEVVEKTTGLFGHNVDHVRVEVPYKAGLARPVSRQERQETRDYVGA